MSEEDRKMRSLKRMGVVRREAACIIGDRLVTLDPPPAGHSLPVVVRANLMGSIWSHGHRAIGR